MKIWCWLLLAALLAACDADLGPLGGYVLEFNSTKAGSTGLESARTDAGSTTVVVTGGMRTPTGCADLEAEADASGRDIDLTIIAEPQSGSCSTATGFYTYSATLGRFNPGTYRLRVHHKDTSGTRTIYNSDVVVQ